MSVREAGAAPWAERGPGEQEVVLPAAAASAPRAREHVRRVLGELLRGPLAGPVLDGVPGGTLSEAAVEAVVADAVVCVSELVTNAVLHAGTPLAVAVRPCPGDVPPVGADGGPSGGPGPRVRLEVRDGSRVEPQWIPRSLTAATGRGLALITALSADRGVDVHARGKTVWCELSLDPRTRDDEQDAAGEVTAMDAVLAEEWSSVVAELEGEAPRGPLLPARQRPVVDADGSGACPGPIRLLRYPLRRGVRLREHREAVLRELRILTLTHAITDPATAALASDLVDLFGTEYAGHLSPVATLVLHALATGSDSVELQYARVEDHQQLVDQWRRALRDLEVLNDEAVLATPATPADVDELGQWVLDEFSRQLRGQPPRPWDGPLD